MSAEFERVETPNAAQVEAEVLFTGFVGAGRFATKLLVVACMLTSAYTAWRFSWTFTGETPSIYHLLAIPFVTVIAAVAELVKSTQLVYWGALRARNEQDYKQSVRITLLACILWSLLMSIGFLYYTLINPAVLAALAIMHICSVTVPYMTIAAGKAYRSAYPSPIVYTASQGIIEQQVETIAPPVIAKASQIAPRRQEWLWPDMIPSGELAIVSGTGGVGKSLLATTLCSTMSRGGILPGGAAMPIGNSLFLEAEQDPETTTIPDLIAAGADQSKVHVLKQWNAETLLDVTILDKLIREQTGRVDLVVLSPIRFLIQDAQSSNLVIRQRLGPLIEYARSQRLAIIAITHPPGGGGRPAAGSEGYRDLTRCLLTVNLEGQASDGTNLYRVAPEKKSLTAGNGGYLYRIVGADANGMEAKKLVWVNETEALPAPSEPAMSPVQVQSNRDNVIAFRRSEPVQTKTETRLGADDWLADYLRGGPKLLNDLMADAKVAGYGRSTIFAASNKIGVNSDRVDARRVKWSLPSAQQADEEGS